MGVGSSRHVPAEKLTLSEIAEYEQLTCLTKRQLLIAFRKFRSLSPNQMNERGRPCVSIEDAMTLPSLRASPIGDRLCQVCSSAGDGSLTFDDLVDLLSVLCQQAPLSLKIELAFRVFDFDGDGVLDRDDLSSLLARLLPQDTEDTLSEHEMASIVDIVLAENDLDEDGVLSFVEFQHCITRCPDFFTSFTIQL